MNEEVLLSSSVDHAYLSPLRALQNPDGGWGFRPDCESRVEPTAWALIALQEFASQGGRQEIQRGAGFLAKVQLTDGSWAAAPGQTEGCWVTSLACWALSSHREHATALEKGLHWLNQDKPRDAGFWWKLIRKLADRKRLNAQNSSLTGWSWTPHTSSWVEPTCYALIAQQVAAATPDAASAKRRELAQSLLYDRMCPGGGWNCGNPRVYGVAGQPQVGPTVWALMALSEFPERAENRQSVDWLERNRENVQSSESLALTDIALKIYGRANGSASRAAEAFDLSARSSVTALSWSALARSNGTGWLSANSDRSV